MKIKRVLKLGAIWCQPCHVFGKTFEKVAEMEKYNGIEFKEVDIENDDDAELLVEKFGVRNVPTTLILDEEDNLITLCSTCHYNVHHGKQKLNLKGKLKGALKHATQMNSIRKQLLERVYPSAIETFGYITKAKSTLGLTNEGRSVYGGASAGAEAVIADANIPFKEPLKKILRKN